jgi:hypothetical protein
MSPSTETTKIFRRRLSDEDVVDQADIEREARVKGWNAGLDLAASLVALDGDRKLAALIRRQKKEVI